MRLADVLGPSVPLDAATRSIDIAAIASDSRKVVPGAIFIAIPGTKDDGARFVEDAVHRGAVAVVVERGAKLPRGLCVPAIEVDAPRRVLAAAAARFHERQPQTIVAVTGTSGKTSVAEFTRQIFAACGHASASLGTIGVVKPDGAIYGALTTPDPITLHATLADLDRDGVTHLAMEASSHGLDQFRLDGVRLAAGAFTNLGRDHMDYHPTVEAYLAAKMRLVTELVPQGAPVVVNLDGERSCDVAAAALAAGRRVVSVGRGGKFIDVRGVQLDGFAQMLSLHHGGADFSVRLPLVGAYQVENAIVAAGLALSLGEDPATVWRALEHLQGVKGRLEIVGETNGALAIVDYAHKPEALAAALKACRPFVTGRLICVFGCGGDRDAGKRPIMGRIASELADIVIVTDDNPRTENPAAIRCAILRGAPDAHEIGDRAQAIQAAVSMAGPGDVLLIAGKGHETGQIVGDTVLPFSDHEVLSSALQSA